MVQSQLIASTGAAVSAVDVVEGMRAGGCEGAVTAGASWMGRGFSGAVIGGEGKIRLVPSPKDFSRIFTAVTGVSRKLLGVRRVGPDVQI